MRACKPSGPALVAGLLLVLVALAHAADTNTNYTGTPVNLIHPMIFNASLISCQNDARTVCSFEFLTRAGKYRLYDFDLLKGEKGRIYRMNNWSKPRSHASMVAPVPEPQHIYYDPESSFRSKRQIPYVEPTGKFIPMYDSNKLEWLGCQVLNTIKSGNVNIAVCIRDRVLYVCDLQKPNSVCAYEPMDSLMLGGDSNKESYSVPLSAGVVITPPDKIKSDLAFDWVLFDVTGRLIYGRWQFKQSNIFYDLAPVKSDDLRYWDMSHVLNPYSAKNLAPWAATSDYVTANVRSELNKNIKEKMLSSYVQAISPYPSQVGTLKKPTPLCWASGYSFPELNGFSVQCYNKEQNLFKSLPFKKDRTDSNILVLALSYINHNEKTVVDIAYESRHNSGTRLYYGHCQVSKCAIGLDYPDQIRLDYTTQINGSACTFYHIPVAPLDIVAFDDGKCQKMISFYDRHIVMHNFGESLNTEAKVQDNTLSGMLMNAAMSIGNTLYVFSSTNTLSTYTMSLENNCTQMKLVPLTADQNGHDFINENTIRFTQGLGTPLIDYREMVMKTNDTQPPLFGNGTLPSTITPSYPGGVTTPATVINTTLPANNSTSLVPSNSTSTSPINGTMPTTPMNNSTTPRPTSMPTTKKPAPKAKGGSLMIMIIIGLIVVAIIIVGIAYMMCMRRDKTSPVTPRPPILPDRKRDVESFEKLAKTVRSAAHDSPFNAKSIAQAMKSKPVATSSPPANKHRSPKSKRSPGSTKSAKSVKSVKLLSHKSVKSTSPKSALKQRKSVHKSAPAQGQDQAKRPSSPGHKSTKSKVSLSPKSKASLSPKSRASSSPKSKASLSPKSKHAKSSPKSKHGKSSPKSKPT